MHGYPVRMDDYPVSHTQPHLRQCYGQYRAQRLPGFTTGWRRLPVAIVESSNDGCWSLEADGLDAPQRIPRGGLIFIPSQSRHRLCVSRDKPAMTSSWLHLELLDAQGHDSLCDYRPCILRQWPQSVPRLDAVLMASSNSMAGACTQQGLAFTLLAALLPRLPRCPRPALPEDIAMVQSFIHHHYRENLKRDGLARLVGLAPSQFHVRFKRYLGTSPMRYLLDYRLQQAQGLLLTQGQSVEAVAAAVGFHCPFYFSRQFKRFTGVAPSGYAQAAHV